MNGETKDLHALGKYIEEIVKRDSSVSGNFNEAARKADIAQSELYALRIGSRKKPNPDVLHSIAKAFNGDYGRMMQLAGYVYELQQATSTGPEPEIVAISRNAAAKLSAEEQTKLARVMKAYIDSN